MDSPVVSPAVILAVDDQPAVLRLLKFELDQEGFRLITTQHPGDVLRLVEEQRPDLVLLDIDMPVLSGLDVLRQLREERCVAIILVSGMDTDGDRIRGLELGADDYIVKPFHGRELAARIRAVLRRNAGFRNTQRIVRTGAVEIDICARSVRRDGQTVAMTRTEWLLLSQLAANAGTLMLNEELLTKVWGAEYRHELQYLRIWISLLRRKIEENPAQPQSILTMPGLGYRLDGVVVAGPEAVAARGMAKPS